MLSRRPRRDNAVKSSLDDASTKGVPSFRIAQASSQAGQFRASQRPSFAITLGIGCVLFPLFFFNSPGTTDYSDWLSWSEILRHHGLVTGYGEIVAMYPPLGQGALWAASFLGSVFNTTPFVSIKLVILISGYLSTALFWMWRKSVSISLCLLWITSGIMLGYLDVLFVPALLLTLWSMERGRYASGGLFYAIACFTKWQPLILAPFLFVYACKHRAALAFLAPIVGISAGLYIVFGNALISDLLLSFEQNLLSGNALNFPLLIDGVLRHSGFARLTDCRPQSPWDWQCLTREGAICIYLLKATFIGTYSCILVRFIQRADSDEGAQAFRFDGAQGSEMMSPMARCLAGV